jgi:class 3 adenylate cyclase/tetratricopeptide (TPR) repeat protein
MELMEDLDPEEARKIVDPALKLMIDAVHRCGGYVVQSTGDGIFALFGAPVAHENHPQRALYSAHRMHEAMRHYGEQLRAGHGLNLQLRIGVNIGEVVVRTIQTGTEHTEYSPIGHSTSLAARLQTLATPGSTVITGNMRGLVEGYFQLKALGLTRIKGVSEPVELFEVTGLGPLRTRLQRAAGRGLTKFVGRQREMDALKHAAEQAQAGHGQIVAVMADPGVGKSRLFHEFKPTSQSRWMVLEAYSVSHGKASAYLPVLELLSQYFEIGRDDDDRKQRERVLGKVLGLDRTLEDTLPYLYALHAIAETGDSLAQMDPQIRRRRTLEAIKRILLRESINKPLMIILEDLHWIDSETQALLNLLVDAIANARILLLVNYRPEYRHEWGSRTHYTQLRLDPLGRESAEEMLSALLGNDKGQIPLKHLIIERTQGTPFFMEEMVQALFEEGVLHRNGEVKLAQPISAIKVPPTVKAVLASRIDRLAPPEKELLQTLSVLGCDFTSKLVHCVTLKSSHELDGMLAQLQLGEFINERPSVGDLEYSFKHALTQEVAYNSILLERRKQIHERSARAIEALFEANLSDHYADLARHYERSGNVPKAIDYLHLAAQQGMARSAYSDADANLNAALDLLRTQGEGPERDRTELGLMLSLAMIASVVAASRGLLSSLSILEQALQLSEKIGDDPNRSKILEFLTINYSLLPEHLRRAHALGTELLSIGERTQNSELVGFARSWLGFLAMNKGEFPAAMCELDEAYRLSAIPSLAQSVRPVDWRVHSRAFTSFVLWASGYPARAIARAKEAFVVAREVEAAAADLIFASWWAGNLYLLLGAATTALEFGDRSMRLISQHGVQGLILVQVPLEAWALVQLGQVEAGLSQLLQNKAEIIQMGAASSIAPWLFVGLANAYLASGQTREGIAAMDEGLALSQSTGVRLLESELHRLKGELLLSAGNDEAAAQSFRDAIELARRQSAKSWELRATTSLARLLWKQGHRDKAHVMLSEIYNWFTEGFDTADLKEAKTLLDELSA